MQFSKTYQPKKRATHRRAVQTRPTQKSRMTFERFKQATTGIFNGFEFVELFHAEINKTNAIETLTSNDEAQVITSAGKIINVGYDNVDVYIMTQSALNGDTNKQVRFNRSVYVF